MRAHHRRQVTLHKRVPSKRTERAEAELPVGDLLRQAGLKHTQQRQWVIEVLRQARRSGEHLSAQSIHERLPTGGRKVPLATVYRILSNLEAGSIVDHQRLGSGATVYEVTGGDHHDHIVCIRTGSVSEFQNADDERRFRKLAADRGCDLVDYRLTLYVRPRR